MTVKELIKHLETLNPESHVVVWYNGLWRPVRKDRVFEAEKSITTGKEKQVVIGGY